MPIAFAVDKPVHTVSTVGWSWERLRGLFFAFRQKTDATKEQT